ncbi:hypothetical protein PSY81_23885, partial [Shigella flexneri]|nr:hypothetical protein [Shigella flexneri]
MDQFAKIVPTVLKEEGWNDFSKLIQYRLTVRLTMLTVIP